MEEVYKFLAPTQEIPADVLKPSKRFSTKEILLGILIVIGLIFVSLGIFWCFLIYCLPKIGQMLRTRAEIAALVEEPDVRG